MQNNLCILCPFSSAFSCLFNVNFAHFYKSKCFLKIIAYWDFYINDIKAWMVMGKAYHMTWFKYPHLKNSETPICNCYHRSPVPVSGLSPWWQNSLTSGDRWWQSRLYSGVLQHIALINTCDDTLSPARLYGGTVIHLPLPLTILLLSVSS